MITKSKYRNKKTAHDGILFDSQKEAAYYKRLQLLKHAKDENERVLKFERQVPFVFSVAGVLICTYKLDFKVYYKDKVEYVDVKGFKTDVYIIKKKMMKAFYNIDIKEV
jgi:protein associated with RNAse G/E